MKSSNYYMLAKTMFGLEEILAKELTTLGAQNIKILNRAVSFKGDKGFMYKANLNLRKLNNSEGLDIELSYDGLKIEFNY